MKGYATTILVLLIFFTGLGRCNRSLGLSPTFIVPDDFDTVQSAIDKAEDFSTIVVRDGVYEENIRINKPITLLGEGNSTVIKGDGNGNVVEIFRVPNVTVANFLVDGSGNTGWAGIYIQQSCDINIANNSVVNGYRGVYIWDSHNCVLRNNRLIGNNYNFEVWGLSFEHFLHDVDASNMVNGKPIYYWINYRDCQVPANAGYVGIIGSSNILLRNLNLTGNGQGVLLAYTNNSRIENVNASGNIRGVHMVVSNNNTLAWNNVASNIESGILLTPSYGNEILRNDVIQNNFGIHLSFSSLLTERSNSNVIDKNNVENNYVGIILSASQNNNITNNKVVGNEYGVQIDDSSSNFLFHNNFMNNTIQVKVFDDFSANAWDEGYPSGGNNWSGYSGLDFYRGPYQNETGSDLIGDEPYVINSKNIDEYPLVPPGIDFVYQPSHPRVFDVVSFNGKLVSASGEVISWVWEISDGSIYSGENISHQFLMDGNYDVTLTVYDSRGVINVVTKVVTVMPSSMAEDHLCTQLFLVVTITLAVCVLGFFCYKKFKRHGQKLVQGNDFKAKA